MTVAIALLTHCLYESTLPIQFSLGSMQFRLLGEIFLDHLQDITNVILSFIDHTPCTRRYTFNSLFSHQPFVGVMIMPYFTN